MPFKSVHSPQVQIQKARAIYQGRSNRVRRNKNSAYKSRGHSQNSNHNNNLSENLHSIQQKGITHSLAKQYNSSLLHSKLRTQSYQVSPKKRFFHDKIEKQKKFHNQCQNDRMMKRINQIKNRKNRYIKEAQKLMDFQKQHKIMHESSVLANKKLMEIQREEQNDKFIDRLVQRAKHKQTVKPAINQKLIKSIKLEQSKMKVATGNRHFVQLPPMVFD